VNSNFPDTYDKAVTGDTTDIQIQLMQNEKYTLNPSGWQSGGFCVDVSL